MASIVAGHHARVPRTGPVAEEAGVDSVVEEELGVLRAVRLRLVARTDQVATATGRDDDAAGRALSSLVERGLVGDTPRGWRLTPEGQVRLGELLDAERATVDRAIATGLHERFLVQDRALKELVTTHQVAGADPDACGAEAADVASRLSAFHAGVAPLADEAAALAPRLAPYGPRLAHAATAVAGGDVRFVAHPLVDSYHSVWFELHEDLIRVSGKTRREATTG
jgi:pyruvate,orthophosphate dikinase